MAKGKKRKRIDLENNQTVGYCTVKVSWSSLCLANFRPHLQEALLFCNQIRVLACLVVKEHFFSTLAALKMNPFDPLPFSLNQAYYNRAFTLIRTGKVNDPIPYEDSLRASGDRVLANLARPVYTGVLGLSAIGLMLQYMTKQLAENAATHATEHAQDALENWLRNHVRQSISQEIWESHKQQKKRLPWRELTDQFLLNKPALKTLYESRKETIAIYLDRKDADRLVRMLYTLQEEVQTLALTSGCAMKLFSVLPEAQIDLGNWQFI